MKIQNEAQLTDFIQQFEQGTLPKAAWTHKAHLIVAIWNNWHLDAAIAIEKTKAQILSYNSAVGTPNTENSGYHESLTRFWMIIMDHYLREHQFGSVLEAVKTSMEDAYLSKRLPFRFYHRDTIISKEARFNWVLPDLQELPQDLVC